MSLSKLRREELAEMCERVGKNPEGRTKEELIAILEKRQRQAKEESAKS